MSDEATRFEELYRAHSRAVAGFVGRRLRPDLVDDRVHEVFLVAWRRCADVPDPGIGWRRPPPYSRPFRFSSRTAGPRSGDPTGPSSDAAASSQTPIEQSGTPTPLPSGSPATTGSAQAPAPPDPPATADPAAAPSDQLLALATNAAAWNPSGVGDVGYVRTTTTGYSTVPFDLQRDTVEVTAMVPAVGDRP